MKTAMFFLLSVSFSVMLEAQVPDWENARTVLQNVDYAVSCVVSDGYGQHVLIPNGTTFIHKLLDNNGVELVSNSGHVAPPRGTSGDIDFGASITSFGGVVSIVARNSTTQLYLYQSVDGGANWTGPIQSPTITGGINNVDVSADARGVHVAWDNPAGNKVYYTRYNTNGTWEAPLEITALPGGVTIQGYRPKVVTSTNKVFVSFVKIQTSPSYNIGSSRDYDFTTSTWDNSEKSTGSMGNASIFNQSIAQRGDSLYMVMRRTFVSSPFIPSTLYESHRSINGTWSTPGVLITGGATNNQSNFRRELTRTGDTMYVAYVKDSVKFFYNKPSDPWPQATPFTVSGFTATNPITETISSSRTGAYTYYQYSNSEYRMRRKVLALSGHITENMFFTGNNWITADLTIDSGYTVALKAGSITYVSDNKKLIVANGGTLKKERGSQIIFGSGATFKTTTTLLDLWNMVGIPAVLADSNTSVVYPTATSHSFYFDGTYKQKDTVSNYRGWWVKFGGAQNHTYEGGFIDTMAMIAYNGWNIIGSISSPINTADVFSEPAGHIITPFYKYENGGYAVASTLIPGGGYWVKTDAAGKIILTLRSQLTNGYADPESFDTYDQFTITDASGGKQNLYVRNAILAGTTENIEMPPALPDNSFDVRFSPEEYLQSVTPDSEGVDLSIALNAVTYPVELSWNINPENGLTYTGLPEGGGGLGRGNALGRSRSIVIQNRTDGLIHLNVSSRKVQENLPTQFSLQQNYPNPFNPSTVISYDIPTTVHVTLKVYDVLGREVMTLVNGIVDAGYHQTVMNATNLASGLYFYQLQAGSYSSVKKLVVLK